MQIKPLGFYVLIEVKEVEKTTAAGIVLPEDLIKKEQSVTQFGHVRAIGPTAYVDWAGCKDPIIPPHQQWGVSVGDYIEFQKYEGKPCGLQGHENFRYIPDSHIIGVITDE